MATVENDRVVLMGDFTPEVVTYTREGLITLMELMIHGIEITEPNELRCLADAIHMLRIESE